MSIKLPDNNNILEHMVGKENIGPVIINGHDTSALIDSGSQISTIT